MRGRRRRGEAQTDRATRAALTVTGEDEGEGVGDGDGVGVGDTGNASLQPAGILL
jgi:hypothetical protein